MSSNSNLLMWNRGGRYRKVLPPNTDPEHRGDYTALYIGLDAAIGKDDTYVEGEVKGNTRLVLLPRMSVPAGARGKILLEPNPKLFSSAELQHPTIVDLSQMEGGEEQNYVPCYAKFWRTFDLSELDYLFCAYLLEEK